LNPNNQKELKLNLGKSSLTFPRNKKGHEPNMDPIFQIWVIWNIPKLKYPSILLGFQK
jgi:hypothetical protein